jgi:adenylate kinase
MFVVLIGPPGAGKGTQCQRLSEHLNVPHLSTGDILRAASAEGTDTGRQAQCYLDAGRLVPDDLMIRVVQGRLDQPDCARGCLFDGFPRTLVQARTLDDLLDRRGARLAVVIQVRVEELELIRRLAGRGRSDDKPEVIHDRLQTFYDSIEGLLDYYNRQGLLRTIEGHGTPEDVFGRIRAAMPQPRDAR